MTYSLKDFGSYTVGGRIVEVTEGEPRTIRFTRDAEYTYDPRGHFAVEQTYVQYFVPERRRDLPPVVLVHGGGLHGSMWERTPDGRPGWLHGLLDAGREVHVVDAVERGRAGFPPGLWDGEPILRSMEEAWVLFRLGERTGFRDRRPFAGQQFPTDDLEGFAKGFAPRWLTTSALQSAGIGAVIDRLSQASVICHSQGAELVFDAVRGRESKAHSVVAIEPSALPGEPADLADIPLLLMQGDFLDAEPHWTARAGRWSAFVAARQEFGAGARLCDTRAEVAPGGSHMLMLDRHSAGCLGRILDWGVL